MPYKFPERLRYLRIRKGISQKALAELCGLTEQTIHNYENGKRSPYFRDVKVLADFFGVSLDYLWG